MRLFLDQMIDSIAADFLRKEGYDIECAFSNELSRADDLEIIEYCIRSNRILITLDEHFGDWTFIKLTRHPGVIRLKVNPTTTSNIINVLMPFLRQNILRNFENKLVIVKTNYVRWINTF